MRNLTTHDTRFRFREPLGGRLGETPYIEIRDGEDIPGFDKACLIYVDLWNARQPVRSRVVVVWKVSGSEVVLKLYCNADDSRLKKQFQADLTLTDKILKILFLPDQKLKSTQEYRRIETNTSIPKDEAHELFRGLVSQVETWQAFFKQPAMNKLQGHHYVYVSQEGYYLAYISRGCLRLGLKPAAEDLEVKGFLESYPVYSEGFDFDPQMEPPTVVDNGIYWELPEPKILVILPHDSSNERVAAYYGYLESFRKYEADKKEFAVRMNTASKANEAFVEEERQRQVATARQALLSS